MTTVGAVAGGSITTIEGLAGGAADGDARANNSRAGAPALHHEPSTEGLHPVQRAFVDEQAMQCGYCIPGFIMTSVALLNRTPSPTEEQVREALSLNMCRCGTYQRIVAAVMSASRGGGG
jgi:aerobic-type carbon monoxide dehydrogenase small subunit (CoxS/CutS family)